MNALPNTLALRYRAKFFAGAFGEWTGEAIRVQTLSTYTFDIYV
jgi:hypothetical protein